MARILNLAGGMVLLAATAFAADTSAGQKAFQGQCAICHSAVAGGKKNGPSLYGVVGRTSGTLDGYSYSAIMKKAGLTWSPPELTTYLVAPAKAVPGTKVMYPGLHDAAKLDALIAYLATLK